MVMILRNKQKDWRQERIGEEEEKKRKERKPVKKGKKERKDWEARDVKKMIGRNCQTE